MITINLLYREIIDWMDQYLDTIPHDAEQRIISRLTKDKWLFYYQ